MDMLSLSLARTPTAADIAKGVKDKYCPEAKHIKEKNVLISLSQSWRPRQRLNSYSL